jgi:hypothetical protein
MTHSSIPDLPTTSCRRTGHGCLSIDRRVNMTVHTQATGSRLVFMYGAIAQLTDSAPHRSCAFGFACVSSNKILAAPWVAFGRPLCLRFRRASCRCRSSRCSSPYTRPISRPIERRPIPPGRTDHYVVRGRMKVVNHAGSRLRFSHHRSSMLWIHREAVKMSSTPPRRMSQVSIIAGWVMYRMIDVMRTTVQSVPLVMGMNVAPSRAPQIECRQSS